MLTAEEADAVLEEIQRRFGLVVRSHRIGKTNLRIAELQRVDEMVRAVYPEAVYGHGDAPVWMITWPAAFGLAEYLLLNEKAAGLDVLELGCGTAAPGIALARAGARVVCTDYDPLALALARYNADLNECCSVVTRILDWHEPSLAATFDLVVGSEIVYFEKSFPALLDVLLRCTRPGGRIILSDQVRSQMGPFVEMSRRAGFGHREFRGTVHLHDRSHPVRIVLLERA